MALQMPEVFVPYYPSKLHPMGPKTLASSKTPHTNQRLRWRPLVSAVAIAAALTVSASQAWAVALGRVTVQSQLGQPLRAEIELPQLSAQDAATLQASVAAPERFQALNLSFNPALNDVQFRLVVLPDGRSVLRLSSNTAITEPFLDLLVQANWANGQLLRGYTLLFDPPNLRPATEPLPPVAAVVAPQIPAPPTPAPVPTVTQVRPAVPLPPAAPPRAAAAPTTPPTQAPPAAVRAPAPESVTVRRGDTAGRIAQAHLPAGVSLDQMLVALLQANPDAFMGANVNRLRAGVVLDLPDAQAASATPAPEARRIVQAHSRDFNEFRRRLAALAPAQVAPEATRAAAGAVQAEVADPRPAATAQDRLTLERGTLPDTAADQLAQARQQQAAQQQAAELERNLQELERLRQAALAAATSPAPAAATTAPAATAAPVAPETAVPPTGPTVEVAAAVAPPAPPAPAAEPPAPPAPPLAEAAAPSLVQTLTTHPLALPVAGGAAALLLLGLLAARMRSRRQQERGALDDRDDPQALDTEHDPSRHPDTEAPATSMMYSPSQLDAGGDVDPVAEAEVYLAYGREKQAEDILVEAIRLHPERQPVHLKLLEIYGQRRDVAAFNDAAKVLHLVSGGTGDAWDQAREAGLLLDPDNPLYQWAPSSAMSGATGSVLPDINLDLEPPPPPATPAAEQTADPAPEPQPAATAANDELDALLMGQRKPTTQAEQAIDFDFDLEPAPSSAPAPSPTATSEAAPPPPAAASAPQGLDFDLDLSDFDAPAPQPPASAPAPAPEQTAASDPLPPSLKDLSLDLDLDLGLDTQGADPLETKLSLAQEFDAIGDTDGARSLAQEVEQEATGALKEQARAFLARIG